MEPIESILPYHMGLRQFHLMQLERMKMLKRFSIQPVKSIPLRKYLDSRCWQQRQEVNLTDLPVSPEIPLLLLVLLVLPFA